MGGLHGIAIKYVFTYTCRSDLTLKCRTEVFFSVGNRSWRRYRGAVIPVEDIRKPYGLSKTDVRELVNGYNTQMVRWHSAWDVDHGTNFWFVIFDGSSDLSSLSAKTRNQVRRGLRNFSYRKIEASRITPVVLYDIYRKSHAGYKEFTRYDKYGVFKKDISDKVKTKKYEYVFIYDSNDTLVGYSENLVLDSFCFFENIRIIPEKTKEYAMYGLIHFMKEHYIDERQFTLLSDGARSVGHETGMQEFLVKKFGFRNVYVDIQIGYSPSISLLVKFVWLFRFFIRRFSVGVLGPLNVLLSHEMLRRGYDP